MDPLQPQRTRIDADTNHDYLTNLPANVKDNILMKLPIKDAVRTNILSSKWIDAWVSIPNLDFEEDYHTKIEELIKMVDMVLLGHQGPIQQFKFDRSNVCKEVITRWLLILSRNGIKDLELDFFYTERGNDIPFRLTSCIALERLCLSCCNINIPSFFQGFKQLRTLMLAECNLSGISIEKMVSSSPLLDHLVLNFVKQDCLHIRAPNLTSLQITTEELHDICLETPKLALASFWFVIPSGDYQKFRVARDGTESNIIRALGRLSNIQKLKLDGAFVQYLATGPIPENLPVIFNHLTDLSVWNMCIKPNEISTVRCLFENAPNLEKLYIEFVASDQPNVEAAWESKANLDCLCKHLKVVTLQLSDTSQNTLPLLGFANLVLSTAPILEKLHVSGFWPKNAEIAFEMLKLLPKLSKNVEIAFANQRW